MNTHFVTSIQASHILMHEKIPLFSTCCTTNYFSIMCCVLHGKKSYVIFIQNARQNDCDSLSKDQKYASFEIILQSFTGFLQNVGVKNYDYIVWNFDFIKILMSS